MLRNYISNRPISPHLSVYLPQVSSIFSIWHRISGVFLTTSLIFFLLTLKIFSQLNFSQWYFFISSPIWFLKFLYLTYLFIFAYHALNGIRHIAWDLTLGLEVKLLNFSAIALVFFLFLILIKTIFSF
uniref:Sdh3 n=1 Tax=Polyopes lancifolius TaxID=194517 RepID=A0A891T6M0_9FLOR|nr:Sdh3 [Polyopes lancifolius]QRM91062.1 Sdh3 [Polyopes lancifolius]